MIEKKCLHATPLDVSVSSRASADWEEIKKPSAKKSAIKTIILEAIFGY